MLSPAMPFDTRRIRALTFDCYGTLIDWDTGVRTALRTLTSLAGADLERVAREREEEEQALLGGKYLSYTEILVRSLRAAAARQGRVPQHGELVSFAHSMAHWPAFPDAAGALRRLATGHALAILSNVETKTLQSSIKILGAPFAARITADEIRSYKPAPAHWEEGLKRLHQTRESVLHVAGSLYHDVRPARALGFATCWINRRGEPAPADLDDTLVFPGLAALADFLCGPTAA